MGTASSTLQSDANIFSLRVEFFITEIENHIEQLKRIKFFSDWEVNRHFIIRYEFRF